MHFLTQEHQHFCVWCGKPAAPLSYLCRGCTWVGVKESALRYPPKGWEIHCANCGETLERLDFTANGDVRSQWFLCYSCHIEFGAPVWKEETFIRLTYLESRMNELPIDVGKTYFRLLPQLQEEL